MKVSAVVPCFNRRNYVGRAIDSIMRQTVPVDEILVIDDGSTDGTAEFVESRYGTAVRVVRQANGGASAARRHGILEARGDWIAFLDSDDEWLPDRNAELQRAADSVPSDVAWIFGDLRIITDQGERSSFFKEYGFSIQCSPQIIADSVRFQYPTLLSYLQASLIRREVLLELNCFAEGLRSEDDVLAAIQVGCRYRFAAIPRAVVSYYRTSDLAGSSVAIHGSTQPDAYRARMIAFATVMKTGRRQPWNSLYSTAARELCKVLDDKEVSPRRLALEQFRYGSVSLKSVAFLCVALTGWRGIRIWKAVASSQKRALRRDSQTRGLSTGINVTSKP